MGSLDMCISLCARQIEVRVGLLDIWFWIVWRCGVISDEDSHNFRLETENIVWTAKWIRKQCPSLFARQSLVNSGS